MSSPRFLVVAILAGLIALPAVADASSQTRSRSVGSRAASLELGIISTLSGTREATSSASRPRRPRFMPVYKARSNARDSAFQVYRDPKFNFDRYGVEKCRRLSRSSVTCYTWVSEDVYDDLGYFLDTILCDWLTTSTYTWRGSMKVRPEQIECVLLSEI